MLVMELGDEKLRPTYLGMARPLPVFLLLAPVIGLAGCRLQLCGMFAVSLGFV
jgi:hypothetical protein